MNKMIKIKSTVNLENLVLIKCVFNGIYNIETSPSAS